MIAYATIGVTDFPRAARFYRALATEMRAELLMGSDDAQFLAWVGPDGAPGIGILHPENGQPASVGNGMMIALAAQDPAQVHRLHQIALDHGGACAGMPGPRNDGQFYAGYFRDPDGNKLNAFCMNIAHDSAPVVA